MKTISIDINSVTGDTCGLLVSPGHGRHLTRKKNKWEIIFVKSGKLGIFLEDTDYEVSAGQALIIKPYQLHGGTHDYDSDLQFYWFHFYADECEDGTMLLPYCTPSRPERLVELFENYLIDIYAKRQNPTAKNMIARLMLLEICDFSDKSIDYIDPLATKIQNYIHEHISSTLRASVIAQEMGLSADYIERVYKKAYGETVTTGIQKARVFFSGELLKWSTLTVSEIASLSGFTSVNDFCRVFKRIKSTTPSEFRKRHSHIINNI